MKVIKPLVIFLVIGIFLSFPARALMADYYYNRVSRILDDRSTEHRDFKAISGDTMASYNDAIKSLNKAAAIVPSRPVYYKALSDIYAKLGRWAENMDAVNAPLPADAPSSQEAFRTAIKHLNKAISLEPTNPDYHLALGRLYDATAGDRPYSDNEFQRALKAYPVNAPLRSAVAKHYLLTGKNGDALEQARILARIDESYRASAPARLASYLFGAFEIAWRVSGDTEVVKGMAPDNPDAKEVLRLFLEWKGIEE
ncbi:MAG: tetratricopeptide repeat protein [Nitrospirae bacterium]|nr:tetratricopeptide repeat protein [Nitrospirota bacterium]